MAASDSNTCPFVCPTTEIVGPELEYSDDEDFESTEDIISGSQYKQGMVHGDGPYPPAYGKCVSCLSDHHNLLAVVPPCL
jgi:hypothetical protein